MEYYPVVKRKKLFRHGITPINPKDIMLNEISQSKTDKYCIVPLI